MQINFLSQDIEKFINSLNEATIAKVFRTLDLLEEFSYKLGLPHSKKIGDELFELRIHGAQNVRLFYTFHKSSIVIIHGFVKKSQQLPKRELKLAKHRLKNLH